MPKLTEESLNAIVATIPSWHLEDGKLIRDFTFPDFAAAITFVNQVAQMAEAAEHHPDIDIRYKQVRLALISHDSRGITNRDVRFAGNIEIRFPPQG